MAVIPKINENSISGGGGMRSVRYPMKIGRRRRLAEGVKNFGICVIITSPFWITAAVIGCLVWKLRKTFRSRKSGKIRIGRKKDTEVSQVKLQDYDHMQGGEKDNPAPDQRKQ
jgi:hypothetical protein